MASYTIRKFEPDTRTIEVEYDNGVRTRVYLYPNPETGAYPTGNDLDLYVEAHRPAPVPLGSNLDEIMSLVVPDPVKSED